MTDRWTALIDRSRIGEARIEALAPPAQLNDGEIRLAVRRFGLTANNVTYALLGRSFGGLADSGGYWDFFSKPGGDGVLPVWGFAEIVESRVNALPLGERVYGYWPFASDVTMRPERITDAGFVDATGQRASLPAVYNQYSRVAALADYRDDQADWWPVFRPLLVTGYMIADQFEDERDYGAERVIVASASSKTALMTAHCFRMRAARPRLIGLTSARNRAYVEASGLYDDVMTYDDVDAIPTGTPAAYVDMAGDGAVAAAVHARLADDLRYSLLVGKSHWDGELQLTGLAGPRMAMFFAPGRIAKRTADWGGGELQRRFTEAWTSFLAIAGRISTIDVVEGPQAALDAYRALVAGKVDPRRGIVAAV